MSVSRRVQQNKLEMIVLCYIGLLLHRSLVSRMDRAAFASSEPVVYTMAVVRTKAVESCHSVSCIDRVQYFMLCNNAENKFTCNKVFKTNGAFLPDKCRVILQAVH